MRTKTARRRVTPSAQYSITMRLEYPHEPGWLARVASAIASQGGSIRAVDLVTINKGRTIRDYTVDCTSAEQEQTMVEVVKSIDDLVVMSVSDDTFLMHLGGKVETVSRVPLKTRADLSMAYTPGVARVCMAIHEDVRTSFNLTIRKNCIAVISDGSAVLGLGNIGAAAAMPVMEGKAILFKQFGEVDAFPLCIDTQDPDEIIKFCKQVAPTFGGINLEDISAPRCFYIEDTLERELDIPVFHDDQHGTAIVVLAGLINALKLTGKVKENMKLVIAGAGAAGVACTKIMQGFGVGNVVICDSRGAIYRGRDVGDNPAKKWLAENTNVDNEKGSLKNVMSGADMFMGLSGPGVLDRADILKMRKDPIIFAMANPTPEIMPEEIDDIVSVMGTGRSDYPNQVNNVLAFPGIFRGALDARAERINHEMKIAAAEAIAGVIQEDELSPDYVIPSVFNRRVLREVRRAVWKAAHRTGIAHRMPKGLRIRK